jgi:plastocyanin
LKIAVLISVLLVSGMGVGQEANVQGTFNVVHQTKTGAGSGDAVIWLASTGGKEASAPGATVRLLQKDKRFTPHMLAVPVGTAIEFPNQDPFFHDVFSIYHGKPFDLGLYESGAVRKVRFTQPGVSYIFCNIHPDMSAVVIALSTSYYAVSGRDGSFRISGVPAGRYRLGVWYEFASDAELNSLAREIEIASGDVSLGIFTIHATNVPHEHLNKYGEAYPPEKSSKY